MTNQPGSGGVSLKGFEAASHGTEFSTYISALESFDRLEQLQELKALGHERTGIHAGAHVLDAGCGFGLETLRLARLVFPGGVVRGCDLSSDFLAEARRRAKAAMVDIAFGLLELKRLRKKTGFLQPSDTSGSRRKLRIPEPKRKEKRSTQCTTPIGCERIDNLLTAFFL